MKTGSDLVLVTGPLGWLGSRLVEALVDGGMDQPGLKRPAAGWRIRCLALPGQDTSALRGRSSQIEMVS